MRTTTDKPKKKPTKPPERKAALTLAPLDFGEALKGLLETEPKKPNKDAQE